MPKKLTTDYFRRYLKVAPLSLAVFRGTEAAYFADHELKPPVLDVGCGFGEFAGVYYQNKVEMGIDINLKDLLKAQDSAKYHKLAWVDARDTPFPDNHFQTVISVSVFEHIANIPPVLQEIYRVLKPGGTLIFTANLREMHRELYWPGIFDRFGLPQFRPFYIRRFDRVFQHVSMQSYAWWQKTIPACGFEIVDCRRILDAKKTRLFDLTILSAFPSQFTKKFFGKRVVYRSRWFQNWLFRRFAPLVAAPDDPDTGSVLFCVCRKPDMRSGSA